MESKLDMFVTLPRVDRDDYVEVWFEVTPRHERSALVRIVQICNPKTAEQYKLCEFPLESDRLRIADRTWERGQELRLEAEAARTHHTLEQSDEMHRNED